jgi:hypothetical protein
MSYAQSINENPEDREIDCLPNNADGSIAQQRPAIAATEAKRYTAVEQKADQRTTTIGDGSSRFAFPSAYRLAE